MIYQSFFLDTIDNMVLMLDFILKANWCKVSISLFVGELKKIYSEQSSFSCAFLQ